MAKTVKQLKSGKASYNQTLQFDVQKGIEPPKIRPEKIFDMMGGSVSKKDKGKTKTKSVKKSKSKSKV